MDSDRTARTSLLFELTAALQRVGTGTARVEETLGAVAQALGFPDSVFFALPDSVFATLEVDGETITRLIPAPGGDVDLGQLDALRSLSGRLVHGAVTVDGARRELADLATAPRLWSARAVISSFAFVSVGAALLFGGGPIEAVAGGVVGGGIGWLAEHAGRWRLGRLFEVLAASWAALIAAVGAHAGGAADVTVLSGLIVLVPGFTIHRGMTDLSTGHLVSGTIRMAVAGTALLLMGFGVALGTAVATGLLGAPPAHAAPGGPLWLPTASIVAITPALLVLFRARLADAPAALGSVLIAWFGSIGGARLLGPELGAFVAALAVGLYANAWSRRTDRPSALPLAPGLLLLVPGAVGFKGVAALLGGDPLVAVQTGFSALLVAAALVCGLLVANLVAPLTARRERRPVGAAAPASVGPRGPTSSSDPPTRAA